LIRVKDITSILLSQFYPTFCALTENSKVMCWEVDGVKNSRLYEMTNLMGALTHYSPPSE
jgi:hypothetical protein